jgi:hypothetical protein
MSELYTEHLHDSEPHEPLGSSTRGISPQIASDGPETLPALGRQICHLSNGGVSRRFYKDVCVSFS